MQAVCLPISFSNIRKWCPSLAADRICGFWVILFGQFCVSLLDTGQRAAIAGCVGSAIMCKVVITSRTVSGTVRHRHGRDAGLTWRHRRKLLRAAAIQTQLFFQYKVWMFLLHPSFSSCLSDKLLKLYRITLVRKVSSESSFIPHYWMLVRCCVFCRQFPEGCCSSQSELSSPGRAIINQEFPYGRNQRRPANKPEPSLSLSRKSYSDFYNVI